MITTHGLSITAEGVVGGHSITIDGVAQISSQDGFKAWYHGLDELFKD
jgi:hypothetical protein